MKKSDCNQLKKQVQERYERAIAEAERQRQEGLKSIDEVYRLCHPSHKKYKNNGHASETTNAADQSRSYGYGDLKDAVLEALDYMPPEFTCKSVLKEMKRMKGIEFRYSSVGNRLKRLVKDGVLEIVRKGQGKAPTLFKRLTKENEEKLE